MEIIKLKIADIVPYDKNPRKNDGAVDAVAESIKQCGYCAPIVIDEDNVILAGHTRLKALKKLKYKECECVRKVGMTEEQKRKYRLLDNKTNELAEWDIDLLKGELDGLDFLDFDFGFDIGIESEPQVIVEDDAPEVDNQAEPITKLGDIWQLGRHWLMCGDSTNALNINILMNGKKADLVFTDPPYGMNLDTDYTKMKGNGRKGKKYDKVIGDNDDFKPELISTIFDNFGYCKEIFLWGVDYYFDIIPNFKNGSLIVWDKTLQTNGDAGYNSEFELCWSKTPHKKEVIHFNWFRFFGLSEQDIKTRKHPTQKPLQVIKPFIKKYTDENNIVIDLYGGSGSTLIACEQLNRVCYCMELDPKYCDVIVKRWENFTGNKAKKINGD